MATFDAFMIPNSPKCKKDERNSTKEILILAPFNPSPKIIFQDVKVGCTVSQELEIRNPSSTDVEVELSSRVSLADQHVELSSTHFKIAAGENFDLKITYKPVEEGTFKIPIGLRTNAKFRTDFSVLCVAIAPNKTQKKVLKPENRNAVAARPKPAVPAPRTRKPAAEPPERRKTFVLRGNKENVQTKEPAPPQPAPRNLPPAPSAVRPSLLESLVVSPFVSAPNRFKEVELSPAINGPWNQTSSSPVAESIRRETYGVEEKAVLPTFMGKLANCEEEKSDEVDCSFREVDSFVSAFHPVTCSTTFKVPVSREGSLGSVADGHDRLSGSTYVLDRLSTDTFEKDSDLKEQRSQTRDELRPHGSLHSLSGSILEAISEEGPLKEAATAFEISPPKLPAPKKAPLRMMSPKLITKRKVAVSPQIRIFSPDTPENTKTDKKVTAPKVAMPRLTLTRAPATSRYSIGGAHPSRRTLSHVSKTLSSSRQSLATAASSSRQSLATVASSSRQSLATAASSSRQSSATAASSSRQSLATVASSSGQSLATAASSSGQSLATAASSSGQSLATAASSSGQSLATAASSSGQSLANAASSYRASSASSSRQSVASAASLSRQSLASAASSSRQSFCSAVSSSRQSLSTSSFQSCQSQVSTKSRKARRQEKSEFLYDTDALISEMINNDLVAASTSADPFLTNTLFFDDSWKLKQEQDMIKWLNALLTFPMDLGADADSANLDIADVWQRCCRTEQVQPAPTREDVSSNMYDVQARLSSLRKAAISFLAKSEIRRVLGKVSVQVDKKLLVIREDKDLHLDTGLKYQVIELLLSYNPLWLRIGLEAIYGRTVCLTSNSDVVGLARFMLENLLSDRHITAAHSHPTVPHLRLPTFGVAMKKYILKKFLFLVYFLDRAKANKLIGHDPCLFLKNAKYKESKEILIAFASMFLSGVGDILKHLALLGYHVSVKQQYLDEYEFAVTCLKDLRDGVRLVRVMEIILKNDSLMEKLRVPAISMLQKVHNMEVALKALQDSGYEILGNITARDLVNGHYEKTLSLLWQIIYKFQAPRLETAAKTIQAWWRDRNLFCEIRRRIQARKRARCVAAAVKIQAAWRGLLARKRVERLRVERAAELARRESAAVTIQKTWRMFAARKQLLRAIQASNRIKEWYTGALITRELRVKFLAKRNAAIKIQSLLRGYLTRKRFAHLRLTAAALRIQTWFRRRRTAKLLEGAAIVAELWVKERQRLSRACLIIQTRLRANIEMKKERSKYVALRTATIVIQRRFRLFLLVKRDRMAFLSLRRSATVCQQVFRAKRAMEQQRNRYLQMKQSAVVIQRRFRAKQEMRRIRGRFLVEKDAAVKIQSWFRAVREMRREREEFLRTKRAVKIVEYRYMALVAARRQRYDFETMRAAAIVIQRWYRRTKEMKTIRCSFVEKHCAAVIIQRYYRACRLRQLRNHSAVVIQRKWRATLQMRVERRAYESMQTSAVFLQSWWRSILVMKADKARYENLKNAANVIQRRWRAVIAGKKARQEYLELRMAAVIVQRRWRAKVQMERDRTNYLKIRFAIVVIQERLRSVLRRRGEERLKKAAIFVQRKWRAKKEMEQLRDEFLAIKRAAVFIQRKYRHKLYLRSGDATRRREEKAATKIQSLWRGYITRKKQCAASAEMKERCRAAAEAASKEKTLGYISQSAIDHFRLGQSSKTIEALIALNKITILSREQCIYLAQHDIVTELYNFLSLLNRSELHREFLVHGTAILLNLAKCQETTSFVWQNGSRLLFYLHLMNIWINKEEEVFLNCATVLWHFSLYPEFTKEMVAEPRMRRLLDVFARKAAKRNTFLSLNKYAKVLPSETPSWGLRLKDLKPPRFTVASFAVEVLHNALYGA